MLGTQSKTVRIDTTTLALFGYTILGNLEELKKSFFQKLTMLFTLGYLGHQTKDAASPGKSPLRHTLFRTFGGMVENPTLAVPGPRGLTKDKG